MSSLLKDLLSDKKALWLLGISLVIILILGILVILTLGELFFPLKSSPVAPLDSAMISTQAVQTILADFTQQAMASSLTPAGTSPSATPFPTTTQPLVVTSTSTIYQIPSLTPQVPTFTPTWTSTAIPPTRIVPSLTPVPVVCNSAQFVRDVTVQDSTPFDPDTTFVKIWRVKNTGSCTWTQDYSLVFVSGNAMGAKNVALPTKVGPDQTVDLSVTMKAPSNSGSYRGDWMLNSPSGTRFGVGSSGTSNLYVSIRVMSLYNPNLAYDFAAKYCKAQWESESGLLPCPGTSSGTEGFVTLLDTPKLENRQENELTLWSRPNNAQNGWISGMYPEYTIQTGQRFIAWVGCLADSKDCNVTFRLDFLNTNNGSVKSLGVWQEVYDGMVTVVDLDLSQHAGKIVRFILTVEVAGGDPARANAFWFVPGIVQGAVPTATPTSTATPTATATETSTPTP
jgi:hypothetical protein